MDQIDFTAEVQRIDSNLKARFPNLVTQIYEVGYGIFVIVFDSKLQLASDIEAEFNGYICFAHLLVSLSNVRPETNLRRIEPLKAHEASGSMKGLPLNRSDFLNLVLSKFPKVHLVEIANLESPRAFLFKTQYPLREEEQDNVRDFVTSLNQSFSVTFEVTTDALSGLSSDDRENPQHIWSPRRRPRAPYYVTEDDKFWFDNLNKISTGDLNADGILKPHRPQARCFLDLTSGRHVNLRQLLLLYDEIFCCLPLAENHEAFLLHQRLTNDDLLTLIACGRLKIITSQPEERLSISFLEAAYDQAPTAIFGRRKTAALLLADITKLARNYSLNNCDMFEILSEVANAVSEIINLPPKDILRLLLWPIRAQREALHTLLLRGSKGSLSLGLAEQLSLFAKTNIDVDIDLLAFLLSERVQIGNALNATVFCALDEPDGFSFMGNFLGTQLNLYSSLNEQSVKAWTANSERKASGVKIMPAIPIFEFDRQVPISEFVEDTASASFRANGRALFARLGGLSAEERKSEMVRLDSELRRLARREEKRLLSFDNLDTFASVSSIFVGFIYPPISGICNITRQVEEVLRKHPVVDNFCQTLRYKLFGGSNNQDLDFLSRIDRVASFPHDYC